MVGSGDGFGVGVLGVEYRVVRFFDFVLVCMFFVFVFSFLYLVSII